MGQPTDTEYRLCRWKLNFYCVYIETFEGSQSSHSSDSVQPCMDCFLMMARLGTHAYQASQVTK